MSLSALEALRPGLTALNDFSSILTTAIEALDGNVLKLRGLQDETLGKLQQVDSTVLSHEQRLKILENESSGQRDVVEKAMRTAASLEKNIGAQLDDATRNLHKEILLQRTMNKVDISSLRGKLTRSMSEMLDSIMSPHRVYQESMPVYNPNFTTGESIQFLLDKVQRIDEALGLQHTVNQHITTAITDSEKVQQVYDSLFEDLNNLHIELQQSRKENTNLRNALQMMKSAQNRQDRLVYDILDALGSKDRLRQLRAEIKQERRQQRKHRSETGAEGEEEQEQEEEEEEVEEEEAAATEEAKDEEEVERLEGDGEVIKKRSPSQSSRRSRRSRRPIARRTYELRLQQIDESGLNEPELPEQEQGEGEGNEEVGEAHGVDGEERLPARKPITARFTTLVRREVPVPKRKHYDRSSRRPTSSSEAAALPEEEEEDEDEEDLEEQREEEEGEGETEPQEAEGDPEMEKKSQASTKKTKTMVQKTKKTPVKRSKVVERVKQIRNHREMSDDLDETEDQEEEEEEDQEEVEEEKEGQKEVSRTKPATSSRNTKPAKSTPPATAAKKSQVPISKKPDQRKDTAKSANFYRGDEADLHEEEEAAAEEGAGGGDYRPLGSRSTQRKQKTATFGPSSSTPTTTIVGRDVSKEPNEQEEDETNQQRERRLSENEKGEGEVEENDGDSQSLLTADGSLFNSIDSYDTFAAEDSTIGGHIIDVIEANNLETANVINALREEYNDRLDTVETTVSTFKRIAYAIDDLKIGFEAIRKKVDAVSAGESIEEKLHNALMTKIAKAKEQWSRIYSEILFALENLHQGGQALVDYDDNDNEEEDAEGEGEEEDKGLMTTTLSIEDSLLASTATDPLTLTSSSNEKKKKKKNTPRFFQLAKDLSYAIEDAMDDFAPRETMELTLEKLFPSLNKIHRLAEQMIAADDQARQSTSLDYSFEDLLCSDLTPSMKGLMLEATKCSVPILDEGVAKISLARLLQRLSEEMSKKADKAAVMDAELETRRLLQKKVDQGEFLAMTSKMASSAEVQRLQQMVNEGQYSGSTALVARDSSQHFNSEQSKPLVEQPEFQTLLERLNALANKQFELEQKNDRLVSKEEVHEALKAIVAEIKNLRKNCVLLPVFKEGLKKKVDQSEMERLVKTITEVVGDYNFSADFAQSAAAIHAKCLLCDKPVSSQRSRGGPRANSNPPATTSNAQAMIMSRSTSHLGGAGYDKHEDETLQKKSQPPLLKQLNSPNPAVSKPAKTKVVTDMTILRSTIDPLPEINDSYIDSPRAQGNGLAEIQTKQRIRNSAGGGMGPNYKMDTR